MDGDLFSVTKFVCLISSGGVCRVNYLDVS